MGRQYAAEVAHFPATYEWAVESEIGTLTAAVRRSGLFPLAALGSGGSFSAAQFCADWHQLATGRLAKALTPLEAVALGGTPSGSAVAVFSAGGRNADIRAAFQATLGAEPPIHWVLTGASRSPLADAGRAAGFVTLVECAPPSGHDGFLATNSLLAFCIVTHRAYANAFATETPLPATWDEFTANEHTSDATGDWSDVWKADTIVVLHGYTTRAAAVDFESKCTEAALARVQLADYRSFAHGRHHWLAKHPATPVLALVAPEDSRLAAKTTALLPRRTQVVRVETRFPGMLGGLRALTDVMRLVRGAEAVRGFDPGRPGVPAFGRKLYSLRAIAHAAPSGPNVTVPAAAAVSIGRKTGVRSGSVSDPSQREAWCAAYERARATAEKTEFCAVVFDYDGTLVDPDDRFHELTPRVTDALVRLLSSGARLGVATGRGRSAGCKLREAIPSEFWGGVLIGYYNGGDVAPLADNARPDRRKSVRPGLRTALAALRASEVLSRLATITPRLPQITIEANDPSTAEEVWAATQGALLRAKTPTVRLVRSNHSIDVLAPGVTKRALVDAVRASSFAADAGPVLRIGDRGAWPGNDAELLDNLHGLSVDVVSADPEAAWNFAPPGCRGVRATLSYCAAMRVVRGGGIRLQGLANLSPGDNA